MRVWVEIHHDGDLRARRLVTSDEQIHAMMAEFPPSAARGGVVSLVSFVKAVEKKRLIVALSGHNIKGPVWGMYR